MCKDYDKHSSSITPTQSLSAPRKKQEATFHWNIPMENRRALALKVPKKRERGRIRKKNFSNENK